MKFMAYVFLALVGATAATAIAGPDGSAPVDKITKLLQTMSATVKRDGEQEDKAYNAHACWCDKTASRKASDIEAANADIRTFGQRILKVKGQVATDSGQLDEYNQQLEETKQLIAQRTSIRQKENGRYQSEAAETQEAISSLEKAITTLSDATNTAKSALLQAASHTQSRSAVADVLSKLPTNTGSLSSKHIALLSTFAGSSTSYAPQSATIQGILSDMYATFAANLEGDTQQEAKRNGLFEASDAVDANQLKLLTDSRDKAAASKAEGMLMLADTSAAFDDTQKQLKADIAFFDVTKTQCVSEHTKWTTRTAARNHELEGLTNAITILTKDENRALFDKSIKPGIGRGSFLQVGNTPALLQDGAAVAVARAYGILKTQVQKKHSLRLAALAVQVRTAKAGHFDKVMTAIDTMKKTLSDEGAADKAKKTECLKENQKNTKATSDLSWKIEVSDAKISKLEGLIQLRTGEKAVTVQKLQDTRDAIRTMVSEREASNRAFLQSVKDDEDAIGVLDSAKAELDRPTVTRDASASKTILALFASIVEDLHNEIKSGKKDEADAMRDHLEAKALAEQVVDDLDEKRVTLEGIIAARGSAKQDEGTVKTGHNTSLTAKQNYQSSIKKDCDFNINTFTERATARTAEIEGLDQAKAFLAGQTALVSKKTTVKKLSSIRFLGMH